MTHLSKEQAAAWLNERRKSIGGSEAAAVCGESRWDSAYGIWAKKRGLVPPEEPNIRLLAGQRAEAMIAEFTMMDLEERAPGRFELIRSPRAMVAALVERSGADALEYRAFGEPDDGALIVRRQSHPRCHATPDGLLYDREKQTVSVWEAKTAQQSTADLWRDGTPKYYRIQAQHNAAVLGLSGTFVSVLIGWGQLETDYIPQAEDPVANLDFLSAWYETHIIEGREPQADERDLDTLKRIHRKSSGEVLEALDMDVERIERVTQLDADYPTAHQATKDAEAHKEGIKARVLQIMGDAEELRLPNGAIWTHRPTKKGNRILRRKAPSHE